MRPIASTMTWAAVAAVVNARPMIVPRQPHSDTIAATDTPDMTISVSLWIHSDGSLISARSQDEQLVATFITLTTSELPTVAVTSSMTTSLSNLTTPTTESPHGVTQAPSPSTSLVTLTQSVTTTTHLTEVERQADSTTDVPSIVTSSSTPSTSAIATANVDNVAVSASIFNTCEGIDAACSGDITYYEGGLGACGWTVDTLVDMQIALPVGFMGEASNSNPYCGRSLTIRNPTTGTLVQAKVGDKCMGCTGRSIDLTDALFNAVGDGCDGRCPDFQWWFN